MMILLFLCSLICFLRFASLEETKPMYAYVYPAASADDYFTHYKIWAKGHGYYINPEPHNGCKEVGQVLVDPDDSMCCYLVCDYGPRPRFDIRTGRYDLYVRRNRCPLGTRIGDEFAEMIKHKNYHKDFMRTPCSQHDLKRICSVKYYVRKHMMEKTKDGDEKATTDYVPIADTHGSALSTTTPKYKEVYF